MAFDPGILQTIFSGGFGAILLAIGGYQWTRMDSRVSKLEEERVSRQEFDELRSDVKGIYRKLDTNKDELIEALLKVRG